MRTHAVGPTILTLATFVSLTIGDIDAMDSVDPAIWTLWVRRCGQYMDARGGSDDIDSGDFVSLTIGDIDDMDSLDPAIWTLWVRRCEQYADARGGSDDIDDIYAMSTTMWPILRDDRSILVSICS